MGNQRSKGKARAQLVDSTSSLIISLTYMITICWVVPIAPMVITWVLDLPFTYFVMIWTTGLPFLSLAWYYFFKTRKK